MEKSNCTLGVMIERTNRYGTEYLIVRPMLREGDSEYPLNCSWDRYSNSPAMNFAADLLLRGFCSDIDGGFILASPAYEDTAAIDLNRAQAMVKGLKRVYAAIDKADAREAGDIFAAYCKALGATWAVYRVGPHQGSTYSNNNWRYCAISEGKNRLRSEIAAVKAIWVERNPGKAAAA